MGKIITFKKKMPANKTGKTLILKTKKTPENRNLLRRVKYA